MKKQINPTIKAHLIRGAFYLLLLMAVCAIPFALAQSRSRGTTKRGVVSKFAAAPPVSGAAQATRLSGVRSQAASQSKAGSRLLPYDARPGARMPNLSSWTIVANYPVTSESVSCSSDGTFGYCVGGFDANLGGPTNAFNQYDPVANTWTPLPNIPGAFYDAPSVYASNTNSIYVFGGIDSTFTPSNVLQIYDISAGTWSTGAPMPGPRYFAGAAYYSANGKIYVISGFDQNFLETTTTWEYDPVANTWNTTRANMPVPTGGAGYSIVGQNIYLAGTWNGGNGSNQNYRYDIVADTWTAIAPVPVNIYRPDSGAIGTNCYLVGGGNPFLGSRGFKGPKVLHRSTNSPETSYNSTYIYDTLSDTWSTGPNTNVAHSFTGGTAIGNTLIVVTGFDGITGDTNVVEAATESGGGSPTPTPSCTPIMISGSIANGDPTQTDKLAHSGIPQTCPATTTCAIFGDPSQFRYDSYTFTNSSGATQCVTIDTNTVCNADHAIFTAAYLGSFDPSNICTNWIGDAGSSPDPDQAFQVDVNSGQTLVVVVSEVHHAGCSGYALTITGLCGGGTPTPSPTCTPGGGGTPGPWIAASPYPTTIVRYGFAQTATDFYVFGGVDNGFTTNAVNKYNLASGTWTSLAPMPFGDEAPTCALDESGGIVYCADGFGTNQFAAYNIASNSWTSLASDPFVPDHYGSASGFFNGKVFVAGGTSSFSNQVDVYDVGTNTWSIGTPAPVGPFLLAGYHQIGQFLYVVGGFDPSAVNYPTTLRLDMSTGTWDTGPVFTPQLADFGLAYDPGTNKLYSLGGDLPNDGNFFDSTNQVNELDVSAWPGGTWNPSPPDLPLPNRQANQAGFFGSGDIWSVGGIDGATFIFEGEVWHRNNGGGGCVSPTPTITPISPTPTATATAPSATPTLTATATATATAPTPTATATATSTVVASATPTATATATHTPRPTPTPRPAPTPTERDGNCWFFNSTCTDIPQMVNVSCIECIVNSGGLSFEDGAGCVTTCPMR